MKKFIKSKIDHSEITNRTSPSAVPDPPPAPNLSSNAVKINSKVQPPLPLEPPPDTPANLNIQVQQEVEDMDYGTCNNPAEFEPGSSQSTTVSQFHSFRYRDITRGTRKRQGSCRFAHKYDISQLVGMYTFCHNYQKSVCTNVNCKYVHASVFEERNFYRTGILPPHALAHHRKVNAVNTVNVLQPPPPPPPQVNYMENRSHILPPHALAHHRKVNAVNTVNVLQPPPPLPPQDENNFNRVGVEEHQIKFRPSPNFKNMKKFIKSKIDHSEITNRTSPSAVPDPPPAPNLSSNAVKINSKVQPPLPLEPPPDTPAHLNIQVKQEVEDMDYGTCNNPAEFEPESSQSNKVSQESMEKSKQTICRDFIRGTCKRQGSCRFAHKYDISQLVGVYTFCHKYQNSVCTYVNCKYVHASVFEERNFYRTGILPPHALAHHRKANAVNTVNVLQPPPPPPPQEPPPVQPITFSNPPPPIPNEIERPILSCIPVNSMENRSFSDPIMLGNTSPGKLTWKTIEEFGSSSDIIANKQTSKKCKHCDVMEFRLQYNKDKVEKMLHSKQEQDKNMALLDKRSEKLYSILAALLKPTCVTKPQNQPNTSMSSLNSEKEKTLLEQLNTILGVSNRLSALGEPK